MSIDKMKNKLITKDVKNSVNSLILTNSIKKSTLKFYKAVRENCFSLLGVSAYAKYGRQKKNDIFLENVHDNYTLRTGLVEPRKMDCIVVQVVYK